MSEVIESGVACRRCNQRAGSRVPKTVVRATSICRRRECLGCGYRYSTHESVGVRRYRFKAAAAGPGVWCACSGCGTLRGTLAHAMKCRAGSCSDPDVPVKRRANDRLSLQRSRVNDGEPAETMADKEDILAAFAAGNAALMRRIDEVGDRVDALAAISKTNFERIESELKTAVDRIDTKLARHETRIEVLEARP